jgi:hypothetical protein
MTTEITDTEPAEAERRSAIARVVELNEPIRRLPQVPNRSELIAERRRLVRLLVDGGMSQRALAKEVGMNATRIRTILECEPASSQATL